MRVYEMCPDCERYLTITFADVKDVRLFAGMNWTSIAKDWRPLRVIDEILSEEDRALPRSDFPKLFGSISVFNTHSREALWPLISPYAELLPLMHETQDLYVVNTTKHLDAIDMDRSEIRRFSSGRICDIKHYVIKEEVVADVPIFRPACAPHFPALVSEELVDLVERHELLGFRFTPCEMI